MNLDIEKIIREFIEKTVHMSLGTSRENKPWVCEVHFAYDEHLNLYFVSMTNTRHCLEIAANPNVAGNIVKQHDLTEGPNGIYFEGTAEELTPASREDMERYCKRLKRDINELEEFLTGDSGRSMYKITVTNWAAFGKFDGEKNRKYELAWKGGSK